MVMVTSMSLNVQRSANTSAGWVDGVVDHHP
jgi:hypothetical protein